MKYLQLILLLCLIQPCILVAKQTGFPSEIRQVTVFSKGAQINRHADVMLKPGVQEILIKNLPKNLTESIISVKPVSSVIRSISYRIDYLKEEQQRVDEELELYNNIRRYKSSIADLKVQREVLDEEVNFIKSNRDISGKFNKVDLDRIRGINEYYAERIAVLYKQRHDISTEIIETEKVLTKTRQQLNYKKQEVSDTAGELLLTIEATDFTNEPLIISYFIEEAGWFPSYDFRVKDVNSPMRVVYKANVSQQTGEDWKDVEVVISSANPKETSRAPEMEVWRIDNFGSAPFESNYDRSDGKDGEVTGRVTSASDGNGIPGVNVLVKGTTIGAITDIDGNYSVQIPSKEAVLEFSFVGLVTVSRSVGERKVMNVVMEEDVQTLEEVIVTGYAVSGSSRSYSAALHGSTAGVRIRGNSSITVNSNITTKNGQVDFELTVNGRQTIKTGGSKKSLDMLTYEVDAGYQYVCSPRYNNNAFLFAHIADWEELNLLSGEVNLFYEGVYKGKTLLDAGSSADTLKISMGADKQIKVDLEEIAIEKEDNLFAKRKKIYEWQINVRNLKDQAINLLIKDQVPVSRSKLIEVEIVTTDGAVHDEKNGYIDWDLALRPDEEISKKLAYEVKYSNKVSFIND